MLRAPIVFRSSPERLAPSPALQPVQGGIERTLLNAQEMLQTFGDRPAVVGFKRKNSENQQV
jgi:hypothetical protein